GANNSWLGVLASPFAPRAVLLHSTRASPVGARAPGANNGWLGVLASPFAPRAVLLQSCTRLLRRRTRPGCEQQLARCFGLPFAPGAVLLQSTRASCVGAPAPGANNGRLGVLACPSHRGRCSCNQHAPLL